MRTLAYAIAGVILGYGFPVMCKYIEFVLLKLIDLARM
jgi:hypothetical protein